MPPYNPYQQPEQQPQPAQPVSPMPVPSAPPAPTPVFGQAPIYQVDEAPKKFPIWLIFVLIAAVLGAGALLTCVIVFMR
jgi:hypothetical protein